MFARKGKLQHKLHNASKRWNAFYSALNINLVPGQGDDQKTSLSISYYLASDNLFPFLGSLLLFVFPFVGSSNTKRLCAVGEMKRVEEGDAECAIITRSLTTMCCYFAYIKAQDDYKSNVEELIYVTLCANPISVFWKAVGTPCLYLGPDFYPKRSRRLWGLVVEQ